LKQLIGSFKCADVICDFCGSVAQVKATRVKSPDARLQRIPGAAWGVQEEKIKAGIYHPLYIVKVVKWKPVAIEYISADFLTPKMYVPRKAPLKPTAHRAGWVGFDYDLRQLDEHVIVTVWPSEVPTVSKKKAIDSTQEKVQATKDTKLEIFASANRVSLA
jgi:hypothetical protein